MHSLSQQDTAVKHPGGHNFELMGWLLFRITGAAFWTFSFLSSISRVSVAVDLSREEKIALKNLYKPGLEMTVGGDVRWSVKFLMTSDTGLMLSHDSSFTGPYKICNWLREGKEWLLGKIGSGHHMWIGCIFFSSMWENVCCEYDTPSQNEVAYTKHNIKWRWKKKSTILLLSLYILLFTVPHFFLFMLMIITDTLLSSC